MSEPLPPLDNPGPWLPNGPGLVPPPLGDPETRGATTGGLPYPESGEPLKDAANAIKSLALAVDDRGGGWKTMRGRVYLDFDGGRPRNSYKIPFPPGWATIGGIMISCEWGDTPAPGGVGPPVPLTTAVETMQTSVAAGIGLLGYRPPVPGTTDSQWFTGYSWLDYFAWGT